tara:strand:- start:97 stop:1011 length:915 start_codon:yes stop_codon:yes gene_type:complete
LKTLTFIGANGFIGKSFLDAFNRGLLEKFNIKKINLISRDINDLKKIQISKKISLIKGDISKLKFLPISDYIIYAAENAEIKTKKNFEKIIKGSKNSIDNFCKIVKKQKKTKILYISSGIVHKSKNKNYNIKSPLEAYTAIKIYSESEIKKLSKFKLKTSIARCFTFIGMWLPRKSKYAIGNFIDDVIKNKSILIKKKNKVIRSYMYADDMISWLTTICIKSKIKTTIYDVGSDYKIEIEQLAKLFSHLFNKKIKFKKLNYNAKKIDRYLPNLKRTKEKLKLKINYKLKDAILITIKRINEKIR